MSNKKIKTEKKILVIFYTMNGNTKYIAKNIAKHINADILELKPVHQKRRKGFLKYFISGFQVIFNFKPKLEQYQTDLNHYDLIIIGTPIWASTFTPAINTFINQEHLSDKKIALFCCYGRNPGKTFYQLKNKLNRNTFIGEKSFQNPLINNSTENKDKALQWADELVKTISTSDD